MAQNTLANILIAFIVFGLVVSALATTMIGWGNDYGRAIDPKFADSFNRINETNQLSSEMSEKIQGADVSTAGGVYNGVTGAALALKLVISTPFTMLKLMSTTIGETVGIPPIFITAFVSIALIVIIFAIIAIFMRGNV